ncbi:5-formyltetrahydrofolate cyclo-ligase [Pontiella sp.]|uniref:5-formyltetrahydrofolate cyclo-ligase n=1 Tax=Pontiella sp. TaxID=2837462 RepID=UPI0035621D28
MLPTKQQIRSEIVLQRNALNVQWLETASQRLVQRFQTLEEFQSSKTVALYKAIAGEVNLDPLFPLCWEQGKRTCMPVFNRALRIYEMAEVTRDTPFRTAHYGIREPIEPSLLKMQEIDLIAVPGVAFDLSGNRLGRGGGYYDRMLAQFSGAAAGICFDFQVLESVPVSAHDIPMSHLVTETKSVKVHNER